MYHRRMLRCAVALTVVMLPATALASPHDGDKAGCGAQSQASFPGDSFTSANNLVIGPLSMIGAGREVSTSTVKQFDGQKFAVLVRAGHTVTVKVSRTSSGSLTHGRNRAGSRKITFRACGAAKAASEAGGEPVTFWSGFVRLSNPACVRLKVWTDRAADPRPASIRMGRDCG